MNLSEINLNNQDWRKFKSLICTPNFHYAMLIYFYMFFFSPKMPCVCESGTMLSIMIRRRREREGAGAD